MLEKTSEFHSFITNIKTRIKSSQLHALRTVNRELISLYWDIGKQIVDKQNEQGWGSSVVEILAKELQSEFAGMAGFSRANIWRMRNFYITYKDLINLAQLARERGNYQKIENSGYRNVELDSFP